MAKTLESPDPTAGTTVIDQNIEAVLAMQRAESSAVTRHQRAIERMVGVLAVPAFLFVTLFAIVGWVTINVGFIATGRKPWDDPPFGWLQTGLSMLAIVMTSVVVITQNRLGKVAEINAQVDLQINLLVDQKAAKIIQLLEEMRVDLPTVPNRVDPQAEALQVALDPSHVATVIAEKMSNEAVETVEEGVTEAMGMPRMAEGAS